jgi:SAM-dependent methyltransferase
VTDFSAVPIDLVRDYWDRRPCNLRHSAAPVGTREYFDQVEARKYFVEPHIPAFADFARWRGKRVLEIGCGLGTESVNFARAGAILTAVDLSPKSLELCRQRFAVYGLAADFYVGSAERLSDFLPIEPYDLVFSFGVLHHTPNPPAAIEQIRRYLAPAGELRIMVYSKFSYKLFWIMHQTGDWDFARMDEIIARYSEAQTGCPVTYTYTFAEVRELLTGFEILEIKKDHIFPYDVEAYRRYEYQKEPCWQGVSAERFRQFEAELGWHTLVKARLKNS